MRDVFYYKRINSIELNISCFDVNYNQGLK